jgi:hypothetical protein
VGSSLESQKSTTTLRPASPPLALTMSAHALTAFTDFWNSPGCTGVFTSAIMATRMVVAVIPTSLAGAAEPDGAADADPDAAELAVLPDADPVDELLELQPAASRTAASAAITVRKRARAGNGRLARPPAPLGLSLLPVTLVSSTTSSHVVLTGHYKTQARDVCGAVRLGPLEGRTLPAA